MSRMSPRTCSCWRSWEGGSLRGSVLCIRNSCALEKCRTRTACPLRQRMHPRNLQWKTKGLVYPMSTLGRPSCSLHLQQFLDHILQTTKPAFCAPQVTHAYSFYRQTEGAWYQSAEAYLPSVAASARAGERERTTSPHTRRARYLEASITALLRPVDLCVTPCTYRSNHTRWSAWIMEETEGYRERGRELGPAEHLAGEHALVDCCHVVWLEVVSPCLAHLCLLV